MTFKKDCKELKFSWSPTSVGGRLRGILPQVSCPARVVKSHCKLPAEVLRSIYYQRKTFRHV